jgi:hypothetical protein
MEAVPVCFQFGAASSGGKNDPSVVLPSFPGEKAQHPFYSLAFSLNKTAIRKYLKLNSYFLSY